MPIISADFELIALPYLYGRRAPEPENAMSTGPEAVLAVPGFVTALEGLGLASPPRLLEGLDEPDLAYTAGKTGLDVSGFFPGDQMGRYYGQIEPLARHVAETRAMGRMAFALNASCSAAVGMYAGLAGPRVGMIWLDAHDDASTPETSASGLLEGMPVAMIAGRCWQAFCAKVPNFTPLAAENIVTIGLHEGFADRPARPNLPGRHVNAARIADMGLEPALAEALDDLATRCDKVYVHWDVDVVDPSVLRVSRYMAKGGLSRAQLMTVFAAISERFDILGLDVASFDPTIEDGSAAVLAGMILEGLGLLKG